MQSKEGSKPYLCACVGPRRSSIGVLASKQQGACLGGVLIIIGRRDILFYSNLRCRIRCMPSTYPVTS